MKTVQKFVSYDDLKSCENNANKNDDLVLKRHNAFHKVIEVFRRMTMLQRSKDNSLK